VGRRVIRLGRISYANMAPVFYRVDAEYEEFTGVPTVLNRQLIAGEIDAAPISSIEYARNADRLRLLPRLCVASEGAVDSIQLVSRLPLAPRLASGVGARLLAAQVLFGAGRWPGVKRGGDARGVDRFGPRGGRVACAAEYSRGCREATNGRAGE
jgi:hypothetical protein